MLVNGLKAMEVGTEPAVPDEALATTDAFSPAATHAYWLRAVLLMQDIQQQQTNSRSQARQPPIRYKSMADGAAMERLVRNGKQNRTVTITC
jgi:hypothetical protein